ncbi:MULTISPECIES: Na+/H+ antiporter NhaA [Pseudomonas]|uniref:Na(+)/H(+) antiporter NhaA n=2 Tax=Pseudomonas TaxID=286 RepID=A0A7W2Q8C9_9PSED|nr:MULTISPECIES: Na+/H+ antiporter NhaA [Pseudomonas]MBA6096670.1 Na+/H+ antiporter NhaA [Pseudomonas juntendi]MBH3383998.1 Na+/H+ antiporter NhaA [Pseudomonas juntendi]MBR7519848.1 Na+/H+ antiporter NhaA [Pseudomonas juntendi]PYC04911.1 Na+/H+ antiporter NhaA [Pseudomonas sp. MB-090624]WBM34746.1 Na+/H+ antiporter NhaA [Pseudomonas sp. NY11382]
MPKTDLPRAQKLAERAFASLQRFLHIEAVSGIVLLVAAIAALVWANSPAADSYEALWHAPITFGVGSHVYAQSLHFWVNDGLMTIFFLVVGMEIRREIHEGALASLRQAMLPMAAAVGGVAAPALLYLGIVHSPADQQGWAVPTATDIAFAVGVLALLGKSIPSNVRVFLLALAIIDDIIAVLIIAVFYSGGLDYSGFGVAAIGLLMVIALQKIGVGSAYAYIVPGAIVWLGILLTGAHPTLAGVVLGLMTPVAAMPMRERPLDAISRFTNELLGRAKAPERDASELIDPLKRLRLAQRELLPPVVRMQGTLHPWVAYGIMPVFALANAGVSLAGVDLSAAGPQWVMIAVVVALVAGKPLGIISVSWLMVRLGWCALPAGVNWRSITLVGLLAGIGFTMSIFIANLAFVDPGSLGAAKLGVLSASVIAAVLGLTWGVCSVRRAAPAGNLGSST